ncbi:PTS system IIA component (Fru family) [Glaciihabitans tibetensis]|uniref:Mannitol-specific phosphotransferase enzyme IIA component n=1 Tax=Glaciihabitans tibetensis TaxID=1266600 RepID=A0A2T0VJM4_9MICO|nr:PTS sugar transporter subunit IIA [Glaciihabitans tibetensis]PRY70417.1 PTS system IIA component (Fru family) [Glaciihabitans tibetensis]
MTELSFERLHELLSADSVFLEASATGREDAVRQAGDALVRAGAVDPDYVDAMLEREGSVSTYVGEGIAMPHGTLNAKHQVKSDALVLLRFRDGIDWGGERVTVVLGVAAHGRHYIALISQIASVLLDPGRADALRAAESVDEVYALFG